MKLNNKGFAISIILYSTAAIILVVMLLILAVDVASIKNANGLIDVIKENISGLELED